MIEMRNDATMRVIGGSTKELHQELKPTNLSLHNMHVINVFSANHR